MIDTILRLLAEIRPYEVIARDSELIQSGILDSLAILALVTELEDTFDIKIDDDAITVQNFATVEDIAELVKRKEALQ